ncbi:uncharacterized protein CEXT_595961 [Caerostris extrusa]|uniref:Odorant receptor n=1 Tax=Caerostris extrusa TaxID=172846 RepID=A0AAV4Y1S0_CAEEX|nr:uncharacterized protein CEXT_595961 [Caerostris extrusa]
MEMRKFSFRKQITSKISTFPVSEQRKKHSRDRLFITRAFYFVAFVFPIEFKQAVARKFFRKLLEYTGTLLLCIYILCDIRNIYKMLGYMPVGAVCSAFLTDVFSVTIRMALIHKRHDIFSAITYLQDVHTHFGVLKCVSYRTCIATGIAASCFIPLSLFWYTVTMCLPGSEKVLRFYTAHTFLGWSSTTNGTTAFSSSFRTTLCFQGRLAGEPGSVTAAVVPVRIHDFFHIQCHHLLADVRFHVCPDRDAGHADHPHADDDHRILHDKLSGGRSARRGKKGEKLGVRRGFEIRIFRSRDQVSVADDGGGVSVRSGCDGLGHVLPQAKFLAEDYKWNVYLCDTFVSGGEPNSAQIKSRLNLLSNGSASTHIERLQLYASFLDENSGKFPNTQVTAFFQVVLLKGNSVSKTGKLRSFLDRVFFH